WIDEGVGSIETRPNKACEGRNRPVLRDRSERRGKFVGQRGFDRELVEGLEIDRGVAAAVIGARVELELLIDRNGRAESGREPITRIELGEHRVAGDVVRPAPFDARLERRAPTG